jgi:hypothetical protein
MLRSPALCKAANRNEAKAATQQPQLVLQEPPSPGADLELLEEPVII